MKLLVAKICIVYTSILSVSSTNYSMESDNGVFYTLYTRKYEDGVILSDNNSFIFDPKKQTKFIIHGYNVNSTSPWILRMSENFLLKENCNVVTVDWSKVGDTLFYLKAVFYTKSVGIDIANATLYLASNFTDNYINYMNKIHLIGHSIGAHIAHFAAETIHNMTKNKISRISGLDPASPFFFDSSTNTSSGLNKTDADFVDVIHTSTNNGIFNPLGHVDFYPNGGQKQPQCSNKSNKVCSHSLAHDYYLKSIESPSYFKGTACSDYSSYLNGKCKHRDKAVMGYFTPSNTRGNFYLQTYYQSQEIRRKINIRGINCI